jgi:hypothetical protein
MKYLRIVFSVVLVVSLGYLYSCSLDNPTKPGSTVSQMTDGVKYNDIDCPGLSGYTSSHACLGFSYQGDTITTSCTNAVVSVVGRKKPGGEIVWSCNYNHPGGGNNTTFGNYAPYGLYITRTVCVTTPYGRKSGQQTFHFGYEDGLILALDPNTTCPDPNQD